MLLISHLHSGKYPHELHEFFFKDQIAARVDLFASLEAGCAFYRTTSLCQQLIFKFCFDFSRLANFRFRLSTHLSFSEAHSTVFSFAVNTLFSFNFFIFRFDKLNALADSNCAIRWRGAHYRDSLIKVNTMCAQTNGIFSYPILWWKTDQTNQLPGQTI